ncbi:CatB-related O-acetyltransferase [Acinetobacter bohemicus]|uniref:CatB-related O-acetyltransferase n=1 Tax=Acinetobacter bohemicus TaxID=1435036 RepID=UPI0021D45395|nr:CatB-related O-acetyltransferase [Acinetobacter bohemicus]MCU7225382.1 CatB-related O-acetyltransferase [Acinetobacter bohemicus]
MKKKFSEIKDNLLKYSIYFTRSGNNRFKDDDEINYKDGVEVESYCAFLVGKNIWEMGAFSYSWSSLPITTQVGRYCSIATDVKVMGLRHPYEWLTTSATTYDRNFIIYQKYLEDKSKIQYARKLPNIHHNKLIIDHDVWIGSRVTLKANLYIGIGAVIAADAVVTKNVPAFAIVGGNPAKIIKYRFDQKTIDKILETEWWKYDFSDIQGLDITNVDTFFKDFDRNRLTEMKINKLIF